VVTTFSKVHKIKIELIIPGKNKNPKNQHNQYNILKYRKKVERDKKNNELKIKNSLLLFLKNLNCYM
jgi:hypothetical protein